jgi:hypothetical protein
MTCELIKFGNVGFGIPSFLINYLETGKLTKKKCIGDETLISVLPTIYISLLPNGYRGFVPLE